MSDATQPEYSAPRIEQNSGTEAADSVSLSHLHRAMFQILKASNQAEDLESFHRAILNVLGSELRARSARILELDTSHDRLDVVLAYGKPTWKDPTDPRSLRGEGSGERPETEAGVQRQVTKGKPFDRLTLSFKLLKRDQIIYVFEVPRALVSQGVQVLESLRSPLENGLRRLHELEILRRSIRVKNQLIASTSHDLRNLLTSITATTSYLHQDLKDSTPGGRKFLPDLLNMQRASDKMTTITSHLLDLTAIESGRTRLDRQERDLSHDLNEYVALYVASAKAKQIQLEVAIPNRAPTAYVDPDRIARVFDNVLNNAVKYTRERGTVKVSWSQTAHETITHVEDTGVGMKPADLAALFEEYRPLSSMPTAGEPSTGLGLAIAKQIIDAHGGRIWAESERGIGSRFCFALPRTSTFRDS